MTSSALVPLTIAVPMFAAAVLAGTQMLGRRLLAEAVALLASGAGTVLCAIVLASAIDHGRLVYWFGGWRPRHGITLGIAFAVDPFGAGLACFTGVLTLSALVFSWRHFQSVGHAFPALLLVFQAALCGFCESGDLFDMFVFFELMTVVAVALTAHRADARAPLQGALNFGVCNAVGGFLVLFGIALLYARTGALNLAQIASALAGHGSDGLVVVAFGLIASGFAVKAAVVPFHFWLADAYASAPTPVCILFAGVMSEMGLYGIARVYWTIFAGPLGPHAAALRVILVGFGCLTALGGALMCVLQRRLKRMLAFATVSSMGLFLIGVGLLDARALAGAAVYVIADGLAKASLFVCVGILQHRRSDPASLQIRGLGRGLPWIGLVFGLGALALEAVPGSGSSVGRALIVAAARGHGYGWVEAVLSSAEILVGAAVLAAAARAFLGWGAGAAQTGSDGPEDADDVSDPEEAAVSPARTPVLLIAPAVVLMLGAYALGALPDVGRIALDGALRFTDTGGFIATVLHGRADPPIAPPSIVLAPALSDDLIGVGSTLVSLLLAGLLLAPGRAPAAIRWTRRGWQRSAERLHALHSGHPGDYVTWLVVGAAVLCGALAVSLG